MDKKTAKFVLVFGLYLGWILSFLYEGPLAGVILKLDENQVNMVLVTMHFLPIIILWASKLKIFTEKTDKVIMNLALLFSLFLSIIFVVLGNNALTNVQFRGLILLAVFSGIVELSFIIVAAGLYIRYVSVRYMFVSIAWIVLIANCIVLICNVLLYFNLETASILFLFMVCFLALMTALLMEKDEIMVHEVHKQLNMPKQSIFLISITLYLLNISGGISFEVINPVIEEAFHLVKVFNNLPYILLCLLVILFIKEKKLQIDYALMCSLGLITIGFILFQFTGNKYIVITSNVFIQSGYGLMDIFMWGQIVVICYVYNKPYKVAFYTMAANVFGVFTGVMLSILFKGSSLFNGLAPIMIALITTVMGMLIIPIIYKKVLVNLDEDIALIEEEEEQIENNIKLKKVDTLTAREKEVVALLVLDITNKKVAEKLFISENTLKKHARNIYKKLGINNKKELKVLMRNENVGNRPL